MFFPPPVDPTGPRSEELTPSIGRDEGLGLGPGKVTFPSLAPLPLEGPVPEAPTEKLFCSMYEVEGDERPLGRRGPKTPAIGGDEGLGLMLGKVTFPSLAPLP